MIVADFRIKNLAQEIEPEYGSGFSYRQLNFARQFFLEYPKVNALRSQFNWTQYRALIQIPDKYKREYYELEAASNCWTARQMQRQINSMLYESNHGTVNPPAIHSLYYTGILN